MPGAQLPFGPTYNYNPAYGGIPSVPNPIYTAGEAITGNLGNLGNIYQLGAGVNQFNVGQSILPFQQNLPNYAATLGQTSQNALQNAQGIIDTPTRNNLINLAAERGVATGNIGSPNANAALMQAMGRTTQGTEQLGLQNFQTLMGLTPQPQLFNPQSMFVDPASMQTAQYLSNLFNSMPVPYASAMANLNAARSGMGAGGSSGYQDPWQFATDAINAYNQAPGRTAPIPTPGTPFQPPPNSAYGDYPVPTPGMDNTSMYGVPGMNDLFNMGDYSQQDPYSQDPILLGPSPWDPFSGIPDYSGGGTGLTGGDFMSGDFISSDSGF